ncbi:MAG TPA: DUF4139 domain-containing protein [Planctomycetota bacterium]
MLAPLIFAVLAAAAAQDPEPGATRRLRPDLDRVTIYAGQAMVERTATVTATMTGSHGVVLGPFPLDASVESFQARVDEGPARFLDLEVRQVVGNSLDGSDRESMAARLENLRAERRALDTDLAGVEAGKELVSAVIRSVESGKDGGAFVAASAAEGMLPLYDFVRERTRELDRETAAYEVSSRSLDARIRELEEKLGTGPGGRLERFQEVHVSLHFPRPGTARLRVSYLVKQASWRPSYEVRVAPDLTGVTVGLVAEVRQRTGEDWDEALVLLSTSTPSVGLDPPRLPARWVDSARPVPATARADSISRRLTDDAGDGPVAAPEVEVHDFGLSAQFELPLRKTVRSDGEAHRFQLRTIPLQVRPERYVVPSLSTWAYLRAEVALGGDAPLLAGAAKVFLGPDFLGEASFPLLRPGDTTTINLGIDPNLTVEYSTVTDERDEPGFLASTVRITRVFRADLRLSASASGAVDVLVEEALPVSRNSDFEVTPTQVQPSPLRDPAALIEQRERGVYRWRFTLAPGQRQSLRWGYVLAFDEELEPQLFDR